MNVSRFGAEASRFATWLCYLPPQTPPSACPISSPIHFSARLSSYRKQRLAEMTQAAFERGNLTRHGMREEGIRNYQAGSLTHTHIRNALRFCWIGFDLSVQPH